MKDSDFVIGGSFWCGEREWRCTDIGTRTITAICLGDTEVVTSFLDPSVPDMTRTLTQAEAKMEGWFNGPPYAVAESVFDEYDQTPCAFDAEGNGKTSTNLSGLRRMSLEDARKDAADRRKARNERQASLASTSGSALTLPIPHSSLEVDDRHPRSGVTLSGEGDPPTDDESATKTRP